MKKNVKGFTLIELVMVIVILGILSAFAVPRFGDFGDNARTASLEGARASVQSASGIVRAQALVAGRGNTTTLNDGSEAPITIEGAAIELVNGYLASVSVGNAAQLNEYLITYSSDPTTNEGVAVASANITITDPEVGSPCFTFTQSTAANTPPTISAISGDWIATGGFDDGGAAAGSCNN